MVDAASIIVSSSGLVALRSLLALRRSVDAKYSYSYLSRCIDIKSRSYLSAVFKEQKKLSPKHIDPLVDILELPLLEAEMLKAKLQLEFGDLSQGEAVKLQSFVADSEKKLTSSKKVSLPEVRELHFVLMLAACLHLFKESRATRRQLLDLFSREKVLEVERGLAELLRNGLFIKEGEHYTFSPEYSNMLYLYTSPTKKDQIDYLKASLTEAASHIGNFDEQSVDRIFYSGIITSERARYIESLTYVKENLRSIQSRIESNPADSLIRFNVQIYPVAHKDDQT